MLEFQFKLQKGFQSWIKKIQRRILIFYAPAIIIAGAFTFFQDGTSMDYFLAKAFGPNSTYFLV
jgi:hypothetical protein